MRHRALLALMVILLSLSCPSSSSAPSGRGSSPPGLYQYYLVNTSSPPNRLSLGAPPDGGFVDLPRDGSALFSAQDFSALSWAPSSFWLSIKVGLFGPAGMNLSFSLRFDADSDGTAETSVRFGNYTSSNSSGDESARLASLEVSGTLEDIRDGRVDLWVNRSDAIDGTLRLSCGAAGNSSRLELPYSIPVWAFIQGERTRPGRVNRSMEFNGSGSRAADPLAEYLWDFDSSDGIGTDATGKNATHEWRTPGTYNVTLRLSWRGHEDQDAVAVVVAGNLPPMATAGRISPQLPNRTVPFRGDGMDADGNISAYTWDFGDGTGSPGKDVDHAYSNPGDYRVVLTVTDDEGANGSDAFTVHVDFSPTVHDLSYQAWGRHVELTANATDPDDSLLNYLWSFPGDIMVEMGSKVNYTFPSSGTHEVTCLVWDPLNSATEATLLVNVTNRAPVLRSLGAVAETDVNKAVQFKPDVEDPDRLDQLTYYWRFGDGHVDRTRSPVHLYTEAGTYKVVLEVSDGEATARKEMELTVKGDEELSAGDVLSLSCLAVFGLGVIIFLARTLGRKPSPEPAYQAPRPGGPPPMAPPDAGVFRPPPPAQRAPARSAAPGACPRCGATEITVFGDGHAKCTRCKKIIYTG